MLYFVLTIFTFYFDFHVGERPNLINWQSKGSKKTLDLLHLCVRIVKNVTLYYITLQYTTLYYILIAIQSTVHLEQLIAHASYNLFCYITTIQNISNPLCTFM